VTDRDLQFEPYPGGAGRLSMTPEQLERAALRLTMRTRIGGAEHRAGHSDLGTDAAMVAEAYLELLRQQRPKVDLTKLRMHPSIQLSSGVYFDFLDPDSTPLSIQDIAAGLSRICRYTGQLAIGEDDVYTVAQHSVLASENAEPGNEYEALMHDSFESVGNDMASPLKQLLLDYKEVESRGETSIARQYGLPHPMSPACKRIDLRMLATEKRDLMPGDMADDKWALIADIEPLPFKIKPWRPSESRRRFLNRYRFLTEGYIPVAGDPLDWPHDHAPRDYVDAFLAKNGLPPARTTNDPEQPWDVSGPLPPSLYTAYDRNAFEYARCRYGKAS